MALCQVMWGIKEYISLLIKHGDDSASVRHSNTKEHRERVICTSKTIASEDAIQANYDSHGTTYSNQHHQPCSLMELHMHVLMWRCGVSHLSAIFTTPRLPSLADDGTFYELRRLSVKLARMIFTINLFLTFEAKSLSKFQL